MSHCCYFQATVVKKETWFFVATLRSFEHVCFDRTCEKQSGRFEFFVPWAYRERFMQLMRWYEAQGIVSDVQESENRLVGDQDL